MRDLLTALAGAVILILVAALAAPPFIAWEEHRALVDRTIGRSLGIPVRSEGRIAVRLLPSPRLRLDRLHLGEAADKPALDARFVKAEVALAPLLKGEFRFTETRIGRAEIRLPVTEDDAVLVPPGLAEAIGARDLAIEDLRVQQFLLTTFVPATGRTDQLYAEGVRLQAPALSGPWRVEGASGGLPFRLASSEIGPDGGVAVKVAGGGDARPRFEADARLTLVPLDPTADARAARTGATRALVPEAEGSARLVVGPPAQAAGAYLPFSLGGKFKSRGSLARFEGVTAEIDPGGQSLRLAGTAQIDLRSWRTALSLEARRLDLDAFLLSPAGQDLIGRGLPGDARPGAAGLPVMLDLDLKVESLVLGREEWSGADFTGTFDRGGGLVLRRFSAVGPGSATVAASGEIDLRPAPRFTGHLSLDAPNSEGIGRTLRRLGVEGPLVAVLDGRPVQAATDLSAASPVLSLRNLRLSLGGASLTGNARYTRAGPDSRGRLDAQIAARGIDVADLPAFDGLPGMLHDHDIGLTIRARDLRYGPTGSGNGTVAASIQSDGAGLVVDSLDVKDLAGANAALSGRIAPDGSGRISGHVSAPAAAPLLTLLDRVWIADARLIPKSLPKTLPKSLPMTLPKAWRAGALDLDVTLARDAGGADTLRAGAKGTIAESRLDLALLTRAGRVDGLDLTIAAPQAGRWFERPDIAALRRPASLRIIGERPGGRAEAPLGFTLSGTVAGLSLSTLKPIVLGSEQAPPWAGEVGIETADLTPFLSLAGSGPIPGPLPANLTIALSGPGEGLRAEVAGRVAGVPVSASLDRAPDGKIAGSATLGRLSLPMTAAALVLPTDARAPPGSAEAWSSARFAPVPAGRPRADLALRVDALDLGRGLSAQAASLTLTLDAEALSLRDVSGTLAGGTLAGSVRIAREGETASLTGEGALRDAAISGLVGGPIRGRISAALRFGASGGSAAGLIGNLAGSGEVTLADLVLPGADPAALDRALTRILAEDDPLREGRLPALLSEEFAAGPLTVRGPASAPATLVGGALRAGPLRLDLGPATWTGTLGIDLRDRRLDARGTLTGGGAPKGWTGGPPSVQLAFAGPLAAPERTVDAAPLANGLAAVVLQRELEKIELYDADQSERTRRRARIEMERARAAALRAAAEEAARQARIRAQQVAAEEAARQARLRLEAEEAARRAGADAERGAAPAEAGQPIDIRPPGGPTQP